MNEKIIDAYEKKILFLTHALNRMNSPNRMISKDEIHDVIKKGEIIEDYPDDPRGHSYLVSGETRARRIIHIVCSPKDEYLAVVTAYIPDPDKWESDLKTRIK